MLHLASRLGRRFTAGPRLCAVASTSQASYFASGVAAANPADDETEKHVMVFNIPYHYDTDLIKAHMGEAGTVEGIKMKSASCAEIAYGDAPAAIRAVDLMNGTVLGGRTIFVRRDLQGQRNKLMPSAKKIFVMGIPPEWTWKEVKSFFSECGDVAFVKTFRGQGGSPEDGHNGTASVEFEDENDAMTAVRTFHRHPIGDDRFLSVRRDRKADPSRGPLVANAAGRQVVFFGLPYRYSEDDVRLIVEGVAPTEAVQIVRDHHGSSRGFARVAFQTEEGARLAIERLDGVVKHGRLWAVKFDKFAAGVPHRTVAHGDSAEGEDLGGGESGEEDSADTRS